MGRVRGVVCTVEGRSPKLTGVPRPYTASGRPGSVPAPMIYVPPPFPPGRPTCFRSTVHGSVFAGRDRHLDEVQEGDAVALIADPPGQDDPEVWVHLPT